MDINYLEEYYNNFNEDERLISQHGSIEYITTMRYIHKYLPKGSNILDVGAGTGIYSIALSREGYNVKAIELVDHNIDIFKQKLSDTDNIDIQKGNALDLSKYNYEEFDAVLIFGPMYHLYTEEEKIKVLEEAKRVLKSSGYIFVAYVMNEATIIQYAFKNDGQNMLRVKELGMVMDDYKCISTPKDLFEMVRVEDINKLNNIVQLTRVELIATDLFTHYIKERIDNFSEEVFNEYVNYHLSVCDRQDLIGMSNHALDILKK